MRKLKFLIWIIFLPNFLFSQIHWQNYENSGFFNDAFSAIDFDNENRPWVGTLLNGVHFFNGSVYQKYNTFNSPIKHDKIYDLIFDNENQLWIATLGGLSILKENYWTNYTTVNSRLPSNVILSLACESNGRVWIGTDNGILEGLNGNLYNSKNSILQSDVIYHVYIDSKGNKWFGTNEELVFFDGKNWQSFSYRNTILPHQAVLGIAESLDGKIWISMGNTYSGTVAVYDGVNWEIYDKNLLDNLSSRVKSIVVTKEGAIWFGTHDKGLIRFKNSEWEAFTTSNSGMPINQIITMEADRNGDLWLGHRNGLTLVQTGQTLDFKLIGDDHQIFFPNPMDTEARVYFPKNVHRTYNLVVTNSNGVPVFKAENVLEGYTFKRRNLSSGIYFYSLFQKGQVFTGKIIIK